MRVQMGRAVFSTGELKMGDAVFLHEGSNGTCSFFDRTAENG
jgi:hypothetical protein